MTFRMEGWRPYSSNCVSNELSPRSRAAILLPDWCYPLPASGLWASPGGWAISGTICLSQDHGALSGRWPGVLGGSGLSLKR